MKQLMMMILLMGVMTTLSAQQLERWVIGAAGGYHTGSGIQVSDNVGETMVETIDGAGNAFILTQGFEQGSTPPPAGVNGAPYNNADLLVYPNPGNSIYQVTLRLPGNTEGQITVFNVLGQPLQQFNVALGHQTVQQQIDLTQYASGVYFVQVTTNDIKLVKKLVHE